MPVGSIMSVGDSPLDSEGVFFAIRVEEGDADLVEHLFVVVVAVVVLLACILLDGVESREVRLPALDLFVCSW